MTVSEKDVRHVAALSKLTLDEGELAAMQSAMGEILDYMKTLEKVPVGNVPDEPKGVSPEVAGRKDIVHPSSDRAALLSSAPVQDGTYLIVPKTVESGG